MELEMPIDEIEYEPLGYKPMEWEIVSTPFSREIPERAKEFFRPYFKQIEFLLTENSPNTLIAHMKARFGSENLGSEMTKLRIGVKKLRVMG